MQIIPVMDLQRGQVVRALGGDRERYRPIESALCGTSDPLHVARRLCEHCATDILYAADLDALQGFAVQRVLLSELLDREPRLGLWLDAGFGDVEAVSALRAAIGPAGRRIRPVFGSESLHSLDDLRRIRTDLPEAVLSLDSRQGRPIDPAGVWDAPALWPAQVIAMGLERVGSQRGPDLAHVAALRARAPQVEWIGSGGIRDEADLAQAEQSGAWAWLVASALHDGRLPARPRGSAAP